MTLSVNRTKDENRSPMLRIEDVRVNIVLIRYSYRNVNWHPLIGVPRYGINARGLLGNYLCR